MSERSTRHSELRKPRRRAGAEWIAILVCAGVLLAGCSVNKPLRQTDYKAPEGPRRVLLMPLDVEVGEVSAAGLYEPKAEWTAQSREQIGKALKQTLASKRVELIDYRDPEGPALIAPEHTQAVKLFEAVRQTIFEYRYQTGSAGSGAVRLPTKKDKFDWTLGAAVQPLKQEYGADYALFVTLQDQEPTTGRKAMNLLMAYLFLAIETSDQQFGFAALVDLDTGDLVWTNVIASALGDLREAEGTRTAIDRLLTDLPL